MIGSQNGVTGIPSPIGYVGSSGGGGCAVYKNFSATFGNGGTETRYIVAHIDS